MVHQWNTYVDTTTANRHHPGESVFRQCLQWLQFYFSARLLVICCISQYLLCYRSLTMRILKMNEKY